jgi:hypothetical protein
MAPVGIDNGNSQHAQLELADLKEQLADVRFMTLREHLSVYLWAAENKMRNGLMLATGDMWTRGYEAAKELREQINILDGVA